MAPRPIGPKPDPDSPFAIHSHGVRFNGDRSSVSLENYFWDALKAIAALRGISNGALVDEIARERRSDNLSSAVRVRILQVVTAERDGLARALERRS